MAYFLRSCRTNRWYKNTSEYTWLKNGEIPADPIGDLATQDNGLSIWIVRDLSDEQRIKRIAAAMILQKGQLTNFDYVLFSLETIEKAGVKTITTDGRTPDSEVNQWHQDIVELNLERLSRLANILWNDDFKTSRVSQKELKKLILQLISSGQLELDKIPKKIKEDLRI